MSSPATIIGSLENADPREFDKSDEMVEGGGVAGICRLARKVCLSSMNGYRSAEGRAICRE